MQTIEANISIKIPEDYVIIKRVDFQELRAKAEKGVTWGLADMKRDLNRWNG